MFGALGGVLPLRLGGTATNGWTAAQHARVAADLVAVGRTTPIATFSFTKVGAAVTITDYRGRNGTGLAYAPTPSSIGNGHARFTWSLPGWENESGDLQPVVITGARLSAVFNGTDHISPGITWSGVVVDTYTESHGASGNGLVDVGGTVRIWGTVGDSARRAIGDYAGDPNKRDSTTEGTTPYADGILRDLQAQRGSAYSTKTGTLVDCENLALARFLAGVGPRNAEKYRANMFPGTSDERLPYWEKFLAVPFAADEPKWQRRQKLAAHYPVSEGPKIEVIRARCTALLGDVFVDVTTSAGADLANPPTLTFWPGINPGPADYDLGGGCWASERDHYFVQVQQPAGMTDGEFLQLVNVQLFRMLDDLLPATATFSWGIGGGFFLDISRLDFTGMTPS
ncbi:MAG TPA: hypothetical protein VFW03_23200 [Gemmatimonadaceae bacterium]|nr:hypothetical protein [Gemmatimonadaceae bacterium]